MCTHGETTWSVFPNSNNGKIKKKNIFCLSLSGSLGLVVRTCTHECGQGHTRQPTRETTERDAEMRCKWHFFEGVYAVQLHIPRAVRCTAPSRTSEVRMPELVACKSAPAQVVRLAWARRLTPLPQPSPRGLLERALARSVPRTTPVACSSLVSSTASRNSESLCTRN